MAVDDEFGLNGILEGDDPMFESPGTDEPCIDDAIKGDDPGDGWFQELDEYLDEEDMLPDMAESSDEGPQDYTAPEPENDSSDDEEGISHIRRKWMGMWQQAESQPAFVMTNTQATQRPRARSTLIR